MHSYHDQRDLIAKARRNRHEDLEVLDDTTVRVLGEAIQAGVAAKAALSRRGLPVATQAALHSQIAVAEAARERLVLANLRLVPWVIQRRGLQKRSLGLDASDLWQEGVIGLMRAAEKFDPDRGAFSTYATWWIRQAVERSIDVKGRLVRQPVHVAGARRSFGSHSADTRRSIAAASRFDRIESLDQLAQEETPTDGVDDIDNVVDFVTRLDSIGPRLQEQVDAVLDANHVDQLLHSLSPREREIIKRRFGLNGPAETLEEIGPTFGVTRERIRQIEKRALTKLQTCFEAAA